MAGRERRLRGGLQPRLTIEHLRVLLSHKVVTRFEATAHARGLIGQTDVPGLVQPEQLVTLLAELLEEGLDAQARQG